jgi:hypothetical protein
MKTSKVILLALLFSTITLRLNAQSELLEKYPSPEKVKVLDDFPREGRSGKSGKGFSANLALLPNGIKKVGLVSFFAFDPGVTRSWTTSTSSSTTAGNIVTTTTTTSSYTKKRSTGGIAPEIAYGALVTSVDPMIAKFKEAGVDLLLPHQFLDTDAKKDLYNKFEVRHRKFADWVRNIGAGGHDQMYGTLEGFKVMDIVDEPYTNYDVTGLIPRRKDNIPDRQVYVYNKDIEMTESLGNDLCTALGLDAVIVSYMTIWMPSKSKIQLQNIRFIMFGPNPVMPVESKGGLIPHVKGLFYCGYSVNPELLIYNESKKDPKSKELNFDGFSNIYVALAKEMGDYIKEGK